MSSPSTSSFRRALSTTRTTLSISPVVPTAEQLQFQSGMRSTAPSSPQSQQLEKNLHLDPDDGISVVQDPQEEDPLDMQEVSKLFLLRRSLHLRVTEETLQYLGTDSLCTDT